MSQGKLGKITVLYDNRLSRQKSSSLTRILNTFRQFAEVKLLDGNLSEDELLQRLEDTSGHLVLIPWYRYISWSKAEAFYGLTRTTGPTIAGYHFGQLMPEEIGSPTHLRSILLDFAGPGSMDVARIVRSLLVDSLRSGIRPLLGGAPPTSIYYEDWLDGQGLGHRIDRILSIPELMKSEWMKRSNSIRVALSSLWSLVYEEGPGKSELAQVLGVDHPQASFQIGANANCLVLRLFYSMPTWSPKNALDYFWPDPQKPGAPAQLLLRYTDLLRVHPIADTPDVEVVATFFKDAPAERFPGQIHTLWIEPLSKTLVQEIPFEKSGLNRPELKPLPTQLPPRASESEAAARQKQISDLGVQILALRKALHQRDEKIEELKAGGVGTAKPLRQPDADSLLDAFLDHFYHARKQYCALQEKIAKLQFCGHDFEKSSDIQLLRQQSLALERKQDEWIRKIADTLRVYAEDRKKVKKAA